ncbi:MAG: substrate-binding domain-containing protein [Rhodospirillales bacterium]|nr:substrate-binding domain-containing protein [Rhodospirillales bacterium]
MKLRFRPITVLVSSIAMVVATLSASAQELRIGGTGSVTEAMRRLAPAFQAETGITLTVLPSLGTTGANNALADGELGLAVGGRDLRDKEKARGLQVSGHLRTPFGFVTSRAGPDNLRRADIVGLYKAADPSWPDGMPLLFVLRPVDESDNEVLAGFFPGMAGATAQLRKRRDIAVAATDQDNADAAERTKGSLVAATLSQVEAEGRNLRFVAIDGAMPTVQAYLDGSYPYVKLLYLVAPAALSGEAKAFLDFLAKPKMQAKLNELGLIAGAR